MKHIFKSQFSKKPKHDVHECIKCGIRVYVFGSLNYIVKLMNTEHADFYKRNKELRANYRNRYQLIHYKNHGMDISVFSSGVLWVRNGNTYHINPFTGKITYKDECKMTMGDKLVKEIL